MKLQLSKKKLKNLSIDSAILPSEMTQIIAGGTVTTVKITDTCNVGCLEHPPIVIPELRWPQ
jgi:hypothetical protein